MPENNNLIDSSEAAEADASTIVYYTEYPTVGQQVVTALISVAVPVVAGFGVLGAFAIAGTMVEKVRERRAARKAASLETVAVPAEQLAPTE